MCACVYLCECVCSCLCVCAGVCVGVCRCVRALSSQVVLASNSSPALNDVTNGELQILTETIAAMDPIIQ